MSLFKKLMSSKLSACAKEKEVGTFVWHPAPAKSIRCCLCCHEVLFFALRYLLVPPHVHSHQSPDVISEQALLHTFEGEPHKGRMHVRDYDAQENAFIRLADTRQWGC